jgi:hypothetical protein
MADGTTKPISQVKVGDQIANSVPGQSGVQVNTVTAIEVVQTDHDFVDVTVKPLAGASVSARSGADSSSVAASSAYEMRTSGAAGVVPIKSAVKRAAIGAAAVLATLGLATGALRSAQPSAALSSPAAALAKGSTASAPTRDAENGASRYRAGGEHGATILAAGGTITTTFLHPFYDETRTAFVQAQSLHVGDVLQTPTGNAVITEVHLYHADTVTYDLTIDGLHTFYVVAGSTPVLVHNCDPTLPGHAATCGCDNGVGEITGVSPSAGDLVVLGKAEVGEPLAQAEGGMTFNGDRYSYFHGNAEPQWVSEVRSAIANPEVNLAVDLGGLPAEPGSTAMDIFQAAAERGKVGWANGPGTDWEMRQIQLASFDDPGLAGRINWYLNGVDVNSQMTGSLLPPGVG